MVTVTDFQERKNLEGETFNVLIVESEPEIVQSNNGKFYARTMKASIPCTFNEKLGKSMIGRKLPGTIIKEKCEPYDYQVNGRTVEMTHTYRYSNIQSMEEVVFGE